MIASSYCWSLDCGLSLFLIHFYTFFFFLIFFSLGKLNKVWILMNVFLIIHDIVHDPLQPLIWKLSGFLIIHDLEIWILVLTSNFLLTYLIFCWKVSSFEQWHLARIFIGLRRVSLFILSANSEALGDFMFWERHFGLTKLLFTLVNLTSEGEESQICM